jgi:long-subunit acyl-CoA synthetase (AMP-forming)
VAQLIFPQISLQKWQLWEPRYLKVGTYSRTTCPVNAFAKTFIFLQVSACLNACVASFHSAYSIPATSIYLQTISAIAQPLRGALGRPAVVGSTGILIAGQEARIVREDGSEADVDEVGELYLRGGNIVLGYWNNEKATKETFMEGGWLRTGDRFKVDKDGNFL